LRAEGELRPLNKLLFYFLNQPSEARLSPEAAPKRKEQRAPPQKRKRKEASPLKREKKKKKSKAARVKPKNKRSPRLII